MPNAFFFRNLNNVGELTDKTKIKSEYSTKPQPYSILGNVYISNDEYQDFCGNFRYNHEFLFRYSDEMKVLGDIWQCVLVTSDPKNGILVMNNGYSHPLFTALPPQKLFDKGMVT